MRETVSSFYTLTSKMWLVVGLLQLVVLAGTGSKMTQPECDSYMRQSEPQVATILECLIAHYNLNQLLGQVHDKMDQVEHKLKEALKKSQDLTIPYRKIDDVLDINEENQDCQKQQQMVQALRRKLEWHNLMNDIDTSQFDWPRPITKFERKALSHDKDPELKLFRKDPKESVALDGVQCLVINSLRSPDVESKSKLLVEKLQREKKDENMV